MILDLNADVGEGAGTDAELMPWITSANVCCGMHAGDAETSAKTLELAKRHGVVCGAHPGFADRENFGRKEHPLDRHQAFLLCLHQFGAICGLAEDVQVRLRHIKPHGALYHLSNRDGEVTKGILDAGYRFGEFMIVGLPGSQCEIAVGEHLAEFGYHWDRDERGATAKDHYIREGFADRRYRPDGSLVPRTEPDAVLHDPKEVVEQVEWLVREKNVRTICVHGDTPGAVEFVRKVRESLIAKGHGIKAFAE
jgi:UPF0271 protein